MDTKSLKHHKRSKKSKSGSKKDNGNVLVVPPDILKKLGISIGNTSTIPQFPNNVNLAQSTEIPNNELVTNKLISNHGKESSETSILETASLMKKSVFLSPTFVPTIANAITGEVEISNMKCLVNPVESKVVTLNNTGMKDILPEAINTEKSLLKNCEINVSCDLTVNGAFNTNPVNNENFSNISTIQCELQIQQGEDNISMDNINEMQDPNNDCLTSIFAHHNDVNLNAKQLKKNTDSIPLPTEKNTIFIDQFVQEKLESKNAKKSVKDGEIQINQVQGDISAFSNSIFVERDEVHEGQTQIAFLECNTTPVEQAELGYDVKSSNVNDINIEQNDERNFSSFIVDKFYREQPDVENDNFSLQCNGPETIVGNCVMQLEQTEAEHRSNNVEQNQIQIIQIDIKDNHNSLEESETQKENTISEHKNNILEENGIILEQYENERISFDQVQIVQNEQNKMSLDKNGLMSNLLDNSEQTAIHVMQGKEINLISLQENTIKINNTGIGKHSIPLEVIKTDHIPIITANITNQLEDLNAIENQDGQVHSQCNIIPLEDSNLAQNICEEYLTDLLSKDEQLEFTDIEMNSDLEENETLIDSFATVDGDCREFSEKEIINHTEANNIELTDNKSSHIDDHNKVQKIFNSTHSKRDTIIHSQTTKCSSHIVNNSDVILPVNKQLNKINILSEEIIPPENLKGLRRAQSPVVPILTPVPLNTIIASKKINDSMGLPNKTVLSKKACTEVSKNDLSGPENRKKSIDSFSLASKDDIAIKKNTIKGNGILTKPRFSDLCEDTLHECPVIENGELKNNIAILDSKINESSVTAVNVRTENSSEIDLAKISNASENCEGKSDSIQNALHMYNIGRCSDKNRNFGEENQNQFDTNIESKVHNNEEADPKKTVANKKKQKKSVDDKSKHEHSTNGLDDCEDKLNNIIKSSKGDTNSHLDKVKEIAEYIKKFSRIYRDGKKGAKDKVPNNKKEILNSKSNLIKSKLCIQGVEKPGGKKGLIDITGGIKPVKTYSRPTKREKSNALVNISEQHHNIACNVVDNSNKDLNTIDIITSDKDQGFCLCYDFGRLDIYDSSYEHIHFWLHNDSSDLESILSIYNDDETKYNDRTKLDNINITENSEDKPVASEICWNYLVNDDCAEKHENVEVSINFQPMDCMINSSAMTGKSLSNNDVNKIQNKGPVENANDTSVAEVDNIEDCVTKTDSHIKTFIDVDTQLEGEGNVSYEIITVVEMEDAQNANLQAADSDQTITTPTVINNYNENGTRESTEQTTQGFRDRSSASNESNMSGDDKEAADETINEENVKNKGTKTDNHKQQSSKPNIMKTPKEKDDSLASNFSKKDSRKRSLPEDESPDVIDISSEEPASKKSIKCGVCSRLLPEAKWEGHVVNKHNYIAWKAGESLDFDDPVLISKLQQKLRATGNLKCSNCSLHTKKFNKFMCHVKTCLNHKESNSRRTSSSNDAVTCGVCHQNVPLVQWMEHIGKEHNYIAWVEGKKTLNPDNEEEVVKYLQNISRGNGGLTCYKCGLKRKRAKIYLSHIESCDGTQDHDMDESIISIDCNTTRQSEEREPVVTDRKTMTCAVCKQEVPVSQWTEHIGREHNYLAWEEGSTPVNADDTEAVWNHLQQFIRYNDGLICYKCGLKRKRVKLYLSHIETCDGEGFNPDESIAADSTEQGADGKLLECGVCNAIVPVSEWNEHIGREHNYLAWRVGSTPLDVNDPDAVKEHLLDIIRNCEGLICYKCGLNRRRVKLYLAHVQNCDGTNRMDESTSSVNLDTTAIKEQVEVTIDRLDYIIQCGVCDEEMSHTMWIEHIGKEHTYLAWKKGEEPLNVDDEDAVKEHLLIISRQENGLKCNKCGVIKKYPKSFQGHVRDCNGETTLDDSRIKIEIEISPFDVSDVKTETVMCGVCDNEVKKSEWYEHMGLEHEYVAWLVGRPAVEVADPAAVQKHLIEVSRMVGGLKCNKCGLVRKYAKTFQHHIENCGADITKVYAALNGQDPVECGVCAEKVDPRDWRDHAMKKHYNVAWIVGATPIEINNPYGVEPYIKEYQQKHNHKLVCKNCGINRVSAVGFYAHIITCGKTEEETEIYKSTCEICNNKYLRIYKSQHMTMHREQEYAQERKILVAKEKAIKKEESDGTLSAEIVAGRRKAAEKAKTVIEKYTSGQGVYCPKCGFSSEIESEMTNHVCVEVKCEGSDSDESVELDHFTDDEDEDSDIDSNISDEEREALYQQQTKSKKHGEYSSQNKIQRLPYQVKNLNSYMRKSAEEFAELYLTDKDLFPTWRNLEYEVVPDTDIEKYMPPLKESCKVRHAETDEWVTYTRFQASKRKDIITMFSGACIHCVRWVPSYVNDETSPVQEFVTVVTHLDSDAPRHLWHDKPTPTPALVQIWDCGNLTSGVPEFVLGLAMDCGVMWALDWCPSGARDILNPENTNEMLRLGLVAIASANGSAYVFPVPHPSTIKEKDHPFIKIKPVVEMRLAMSEERKVFQATAIKWSTQKGHAHIVVGYADGTLAYYDLKNKSPLLQTKEDGVTILYPYHDERAQSMCIEDVDLFPWRGVECGAGAAAAGSVGGAGVSAPGAALQAHAAAARVLFPPHWPAALLAGDDNLVSQAINELEWYGGGRRVGGMRTCGGCAWCGRVAAASAPLIRLLKPHPAYSELHRQVIATINMVQFGNKRKRKNDELSMIMEPITYDDVVTKYGIEFKQVTARDKHTQQRLSGLPREAYPERFPLSDISSIVFCPSSKNHNKLAVATHAGIIFIINV